jgi:hypothetical protein
MNRSLSAVFAALSIGAALAMVPAPGAARARHPGAGTHAPFATRSGWDSPGAGGWRRVWADSFDGPAGSAVNRSV